jgi:hypothetical protein
MLNTIVGIAAGILLGALLIGCVNYLLVQGTFHVGIG